MHIYANWKKAYKGEELKKLFWLVVNSTYEAEFNTHIEALRILDAKGCDDFMKEGPNRFCKAFINTMPTCNAITSNLVDTFNGYIC